MGSYLTSSFSDQGYEVIALYRTLPPRKNDRCPNRDNVLPIEADIRDSFDIGSPIDAVFHSAAISRPNQGSVDDYLRANVVGTRNVLDSACRAGVKKIVNVSTISVYGEIRTSLLDENADHINSDLYGQSKYLAERVLGESSIPSLSLRLPGILGPDATDPWIARVAKKIQHSEDIEIFNGDMPFNSCVHVSDVLSVGMAFIRSQNEERNVANLAASDPIPLSRVLEIMRSELGSTSKISNNPSREKGNYSISSNAVEKIYGGKPLSVKSTIQAYVSDMKSKRRP